MTSQTSAKTPKATSTTVTSTDWVKLLIAEINLQLIAQGSKKRVPLTANNIANLQRIIAGGVEIVLSLCFKLAAVLVVIAMLDYLYQRWQHLEDLKMTKQELREEMKRIADIFRGRVIDVTDSTYVIELTGNGSKLDAFLDAIDRSLILETVRTGVSGIGRGDRILKV